MHDPPPEAEGADGWMECKGPKGYKIHINYDMYGNNLISVVAEEGEYYESIGVDYCGVSQQYGGVMEIRYADGKPFAGIIRYKCLDEGEPGGYPTEKVGEYLIVFGLEGYEHISHQVDVRKTPKANEVARKFADEGYTKGK